MSEQRRFPRRKTYFEGQLALHSLSPLVNCVVKNIGKDGVKVVCAEAAFIDPPAEIDLEIPRLDMRYHARTVWHRANELGLQLIAPRPREKSSEQPRAVFVELRKLDAERKRLRTRICDMTIGF